MSGIFFKLLFKAMMPVIMLVGIMSYTLHLQGGDPMMPLKTVAGGIGDQLSETGRSLRDSAGNLMATEGPELINEKPASRRIYRWVDAEGVTHFGTSRPAAQVPFETVSVNPASNLMDGLRPPQTQVTAKADTAQAAPQMPSAMPMSANPAEIRQMLQGVEQMSESRLQQLESIR
ncbi:MAG TPA: hypothetical protein DD979_13645 [Gammaproteobacteria bacterium]|nr:hypothetical protein [Gammaproteobacteria bacterium]